MHDVDEFTADKRPQSFSKEICRSMVAMLDVDHSGKLDKEELKVLLNDIMSWKVVGSLKSEFKFCC